MLNRFKQISTALLALVVLSGCATATQQKTTGFLGNYQQFVDSNKYDHTKIYQAPSFNLDTIAQLTEVKLEPFELWINTQNNDFFNPRQLTELVNHFNAQLRHQLQAHDYQLVDRIGTETLTLRGAFSDVKFSDPELSVTDFIPFRMVLNAGNAAYLNITDKKDVITTVSIEVELLQGLTQERIFALIATKKIDTTIANSGADNVAAVKDLLDLWVNNFIVKLTKTRANQNTNSGLRDV